MKKSLVPMIFETQSQVQILAVTGTTPMKFHLQPRKTHQPHPDWWLRWGQYLLFGLGTLLLCYVGMMMLMAMLFQAEQSRRFDRDLRDLNGPSSPSGNIHPPFLKPKPPDTTHPGALLGRIEIRRLGLEVMILEGIDETVLQKAVGHFPDSPLPGQPGNVAIAGHRNTYFSSLRQIQPDDEIRLTTLSGTYRYRVDSTIVVNPENISVLANTGGEKLTLVTCYPFNFVGPAPQRFIVRAYRVAE